MVWSNAQGKTAYARNARMAKIENKKDEFRSMIRYRVEAMKLKDDDEKRLEKNLLKYYLPQTTKLENKNKYDNSIDDLVASGVHLALNLKPYYITKNGKKIRIR